MNLIDFLDAHIFTGVAGNAAFSLVKAAWQRANSRTWEDIYLDAFQVALREAKPSLAKYAKEDGDIALNRQSLSHVLHYDLAVEVDTLDYRQLSDKIFAEKLAKAMEDHSLLVIGGHQLSQADYSQLVRNLVRAATNLFKDAVLTHEPAFRHEVVYGLFQQQELTGQVQDFLSKQFGPQVLADLSTIKVTLGDMASGLQQIQASLPGSVSHTLSEIPTAPEPYIAHPYYLLQTSTLIGRQDELNLLTAWASKPESDLYQAHIFSVIALGGMGKSALTWTWFRDVAPRVTPLLAGRLWWSFYESGATFEAFVLHALAYVSKRDKEEVQKLSLSEQESLLFSILDREPYLLVLDGLERLLLAYTSSMKALHFLDDGLDKRTANAVAGVPGPPLSADIPFMGRHRLRKTADVRVGSFLRKLARIRASRILVSSRLFPADLQNETGEPLPGCQALFLSGLADNDALQMWHTLGINGSRESVLPLLHTFGQHPLLIQVLAGVIAHDRKTPGDLERWRTNHPHFSPFQLPLVQVQSHILTIALQGLDEQVWQVLSTTASFHTPVPYETLVALMVGENRCFQREEGLMATLENLEGRGLLGWDKRRGINRYAMHPVVCGMVWSRLDDVARNEIYNRRDEYLINRLIVSEEAATSLEDLAADVEFFYTLIGVGNLPGALYKLNTQLADIMRYLGAHQQLVELMEVLFFPDGLNRAPRRIPPPQSYPREDLFSKSLRFQTWVLNTLAITYKEMGQLEQAMHFFSRALDHGTEVGDNENVLVVQFNLSTVMYLCGKLHAAENAARRALRLAQERQKQYDKFWGQHNRLEVLSETEIGSLLNLSTIMAIRGVAGAELQQALILAEEDDRNGEKPSYYLRKCMLAECALMLNDLASADQLAIDACKIAQRKDPADKMNWVKRIQGTVALRQGNLARASELLHNTLIQARAASDVTKELDALIGLAELLRRQGDLQSAREFLDDVWVSAERGPYRLKHADAYNILAQIERDAENRVAASKAASSAYNLAWCDGPPFAYYRGLQIAKAHLAALGEPEPSLPLFEESTQRYRLDIKTDSLDKLNH